MSNYAVLLCMNADGVCIDEHLTSKGFPLQNQISVDGKYLRLLDQKVEGVESWYIPEPIPAYMVPLLNGKKPEEAGIGEARLFARSIDFHGEGPNA